MPHKEGNNILHNHNNLHNDSDMREDKFHDNIIVSHKNNNGDRNKGIDIFSRLPDEIYYKIFENIRVTDLAAITLVIIRYNFPFLVIELLNCCAIVFVESNCTR